AVGYALAAVLGDAGSAPRELWLPNRLMVVAALPLSALVALLLQRQRLHAERLRASAVAAGEMNRVLMSLLAHDLRAPLVVARQCIDYVEGVLTQGRAPDTALLADTRARLDRSARAIDIVLAVARVELAEGGEREGPVRVRVGDEIREETGLFAGEAAVRGKRIELRLEGVEGAEPVVHGVVLRRALSILLDNAIRYAAPGVVLVSAVLRDGQLRVAVEDPGPATNAPEPRGAGLGLDLAGALLGHAGGSVHRAEASPGSCWVLTLPVAGRTQAARPPVAAG
ncbi:MAG TPA: ATP-binding protein, partial [Longimicrobium sp.]|nr:ATP-binding protein [Longimicrobium sp.]